MAAGEFRTDKAAVHHDADRHTGFNLFEQRRELRLLIATLPAADRRTELRAGVTEILRRVFRGEVPESGIQFCTGCIRFGWRRNRAVSLRRFILCDGSLQRDNSQQRQNPKQARGSGGEIHQRIEYGRAIGSPV